MSKEIWDPLEEMRKLRKEMDETFYKYLRMPTLKAIETGKQQLSIREPMADIAQTNKDIIAKIEIPGVDKKDIQLSVTKNAISVKAQRKHEAEIKKEGYYKQERSYSSFQRSFTLPTEVKANQAQADYKDGILTITVPKLKALPHKEMKRIAVK